jgi:hypothetical protein
MQEAGFSLHNAGYTVTPFQIQLLFTELNEELEEQAWAFLSEFREEHFPDWLELDFFTMMESEPNVIPFYMYFRGEEWTCIESLLESITNSENITIEEAIKFLMRKAGVEE